EVIVDIADSELAEALENIAVYPNPSSDVFNFSYTIHEAGNLQMDVYNINGELVYSDGFAVAPGYQTYTWSAQQLDAGVYMVRMQHGDYAEVLRLIVQ
ncbi:MAG TPA: hypothetical protein DHW15_08150, partial [Bacteroidetes bacterium]|nr:hypothetical protein [Bacteroidota bacterium]